MEQTKECIDTKRIDEEPKKENNEITFEGILSKVGQFGPYQITVFLLISLSDITASLAAQFFIFGAANPGFACVIDEKLNFSEIFRDGQFIPPPENNTQYILDECEIGEQSCIKRFYSTEFTSIITEWDLVCERDYFPTIITTLLMVGQGLGAAFFGHAADWWGRRRVFYFTTTMMTICQLCQSFSVSWEMMAVFRFFVGTFSGGAIVIASVYPVEFIGKGYRTVVGCFGFWGVGTFTLVLFAYFIRDWRNLSLAAALVGAAFPVTVILVPESVRWLLQQDKINSAKRVFDKMAARNKKISPPIEDLEKLAKSPEFTPQIKRYSYKDLFLNSALRSRALVMAFMWFTFNLMFYGIVLDVRDVSDDRYTNIAIMAALEYAFNLSVIYTAQRFGRRISLLSYMATNTISMIIVMVLALTTDSEPALVARTIISLIGRGGVSAAWGVGYLLSAELFPTSVRNIGASACAVAGRIGGAVAPQIAYLRTFNTSIPYIIFASFAVVSALLAAKFLPETKGQPLPDNVYNIRKTHFNESVETGSNGDMNNMDNNNNNKSTDQLFHIAKF